MGISPKNSNFPSQQVFPPSRIYCQKSNLCIFNLIDQFSNHVLSASASCYFSNLLWLYIFIYILWGPKNGLQQPPSLRNLDMLSSMQVVPNMELQLELLINCKYFHTIRSLCWLCKNVGNTAILISEIDIFPASLHTCNLGSNYNSLCVSSDDNCSGRLLPLYAWFFLVALHLWSLV